MANYTQITATNISDAAGNKLANGTIAFQATDASNQPIPFQVGGGGQVVTTPATATITNGQIVGTFQVANPLNTAPSGILYRVTITDNALNKVVAAYALVSFSGDTFNFDNYLQSGAAVVPPAGGVVNGALVVNGNLSVTGTLLSGQPGAGATVKLGTFSLPATMWTLVHNMATQAIQVTCYDNSWNQIFPDSIQNTDVNTSVATFLSNQVGYMVAVNVGNWTPSVSAPNNIISNPSSSQSITGQPLLLLGGGQFGGAFTLNDPSQANPTTLNGAGFFYFQKPSTSHGQEDSLVWGYKAGLGLSVNHCASCDYGNILIGYQVGKNLGSNTPDSDVENTIIGDSAGANLHGSGGNTFIGRAVFTSATSGGGSAVGIGHAAGLSVTTGAAESVMIGDSAGFTATPANACTTGCVNSVFIGLQSGPDNTTQNNNQVAIGPQATVGLPGSGNFGGLTTVWGFNNPYPLAPINPAGPAGKATAATNIVAFFGTSGKIDTPAPFGLQVDVTGGAAIANRAITMQTKEPSVGFGGTLNLNTTAGNIGLGSTTSSIFVGFTDTQMGRCGAACIAFGDGSASANANAQLQFKNLTLGGNIQMGATVFASLGAPANGNLTYCSDCTVANPCASGGTGALAKRLNGVWVCN